MKFVPLCQSGLPNKPTWGHSGVFKIDFDPWWSDELIYQGFDLELTRQRLVHALRHQDGGAHIGELTDPAYVKLKAGAGVSGGVSDGETRPLVEAANATMRQVAWEVTETLKQLDGAGIGWLSDLKLKLNRTGGRVLLVPSRSWPRALPSIESWLRRNEPRPSASAKP